MLKHGGFNCKMQRLEILASLCVARCLCKHMNKNTKEQENGIYLVHAYSDGVREGVITPLLLEPLAKVPICVPSDFTFINTLL